MNVFQENQGHLSGLEVLRSLIATGRRPPIGDTLDFTLIEVDEGYAVFAGVPGPHAYNPLGTIHGGYAATLLDSACACAVHSLLSPMQAYTTLELKVAYHHAMTANIGPVRAEARVISSGKRVAFAEGRLIDTTGRIYASATSTLLIYEHEGCKA